MKKIITILTIAFSFVLVSFTNANAQNSDLDKVVKAIKSGSSSELTKYFDEYVQLTLPGQGDSYSKAQAEQIIKDFFQNNSVKDFELKHQGNAPSGHYCVGTLQTSAGNYRTNVFMKTKGNKEVVKEIRFQLVE